LAIKYEGIQDQEIDQTLDLREIFMKLRFSIKSNSKRTYWI